MGYWFNGPPPKITHLQLEVIRLREHEKKSWFQIAESLGLAGRDKNTRKNYARRLYLRARKTIEGRSFAESHVERILNNRPTQVQRVAQRHIKRQGEMHVDKLPPRPPRPPRSDKPAELKLPIVFLFPSGAHFRDSTASNIPVMVHRVDGKYFDEQNQQVEVIRVRQHQFGWEFIQRLPEGESYWTDLYSRKQLGMAAQRDVERMKV